MEEQAFRRWTAGRMKGLPNAPAPQILEQMFGYEAAHLLSPPIATAPCSEAIEFLDESDLTMTARDAANHAGIAASLSVSDLTLDQLQDDVIALAQTYSCTAPTEVYRRAKDLLGAAQELLERTQVPRQRAHAYLIAGQSAALLSAICFDLGSMSTAVSLARTSALYGKVIENGPLQAYAHGTLAFLAFWRGRPSSAVRLVAAARSFAGIGDTALTRLTVIEARAHGHLGDPEAAGRAIRQSTELDTGIRDELHDDISGEFGFPSERVAMSNATTRLLLKDAVGAAAEASRALHLLESLPAGQRPLLITTQAYADLGRARVLQHDLDGAQEALESVFIVPAEWRGAGVVERLIAVRADLCGPVLRNASLAITLGERIEDFLSRSTVRTLGALNSLAIEGP
ncbi:hypothetical protein AB0F42_10040 [Streptomyces buecherae]|uniref:hypothetical protein n=1 Tax=Streptomyces buecherae TaxID=2763006 RepID=UPI0033CF5564